MEGAVVRVLGQVKMARAIPWRPGLRLSEALARAGGVSWEADQADIRIIRGPLSKPRLYRANFGALVAGQATDVELARGDIVFVTEHWFASTTEVLRRLMPLLTAELVAASILSR
jgi:polysaccharide export outer membrane protein